MGDYRIISSGLLPRFVQPRTLDEIQTALSPRPTWSSSPVFLYEPQDAASGVLPASTQCSAEAQRLPLGPPGNQRWTVHVFRPDEPRFSRVLVLAGLGAKTAPGSPVGMVQRLSSFGGTYSIRLYPSRSETCPTFGPNWRPVGWCRCPRPPPKASHLRTVCQRKRYSRAIPTPRSWRTILAEYREMGR